MCAQSWTHIITKQVIVGTIFHFKTETCIHLMIHHHEFIIYGFREIIFSKNRLISVKFKQ
jgi:hypothetical protein